MQKTLNNPAVKIVGEEFRNTHPLKSVGELEFVSPPCQPQRACRWFWLRPLDTIYHHLYFFFRGGAFQKSVLQKISQTTPTMKSCIDSWMWVCDGADWWLCSKLSLVKLSVIPIALLMKGTS